MHSHGASLREVFALRYGKFDRYVDVVVYPGSTENVQAIVEKPTQPIITVCEFEFLIKTADGAV